MELFTGAEPSPWKPWLIASVAAIAILGVALGLMKLLGLFDIPTDDAGAKTLAAALGLVGSVLATAITLIGTVVKYSIDDRNARLAAVEAGRNYALALEAENRNRIEAAIRAVDLLSENNKDATGHQIGGALLALSSLGEFDLAVALLAQLWRTRLVSRDVAHQVLSWALSRGSEDSQLRAGALLWENPDQIVRGGYKIWPIRGRGWRTDLPEDCRHAMAAAAVQCMKLVEARDNGDKRKLRFPAQVLYEALEDKLPEVSDMAAASLRPLVEALDKALPKARVMYVGEGDVLSVENIVERLGDFMEQGPKTRAGEWAESEILEALAPVAGGPSD